MKTLKLMLMAGLLAGVFSQTTLAAGSDPNDKPVEGAQDVVEGSGCTVCAKNAYGKKLTDSEGPNTSYDDKLNEAGSAGAAGKAEEGTH